MCCFVRSQWQDTVPRPKQCSWHGQPHLLQFWYLKQNISFGWISIKLLIGCAAAKAGAESSRPTESKSDRDTVSDSSGWSLSFVEKLVLQLLVGLLLPRSTLDWKNNDIFCSIMHQTFVLKVKHSSFEIWFIMVIGLQKYSTNWNHFLLFYHSLCLSSLHKSTYNLRQKSLAELREPGSEPPFQVLALEVVILVHTVLLLAASPALTLLSTSSCCFIFSHSHWMVYIPKLQH